MTTERLFYSDPYQREFTAAVVRMEAVTGKYHVVLDRTAFYPDAGGQLCDTGCLGGIPVENVIEQNGEIVHVLPEPPPGETVKGSLDWPVRFDHMQQHAGQHILSQAFLRTAGGETVSFHMGQNVSSIDIAVPGLSAEDAAAAEDAANGVVFGGGAIRTFWAAKDELANYHLRKPPVQAGPIRLVAIAGFDLCPCGGTHPATCGEVGLIKIRKTERIRGNTRVHFYCGWRALVDYRWKNEMINNISTTLTIRDRELDDAFARLTEKNRVLQGDVGFLRRQLHQYQADGLWAAASVHNGVHIVRHVFPDENPAGLKEIAALLTARPATVALLGATGDGVHLVFARSEDTGGNMGHLLRAAAAAVDGKGGGSARSAQGGGSRPEELPAALAAADAALRKEIS
ncbi:MAG: alanyl-tRNA editing protein [bacterium]|jgi:alanyl-tRNA synthetase